MSARVPEDATKLVVWLCGRLDGGSGRQRTEAAHRLADVLLVTRDASLRDLALGAGGPQSVANLLLTAKTLTMKAAMLRCLGAMACIHSGPAEAGVMAGVDPGFVAVAVTAVWPAVRLLEDEEQLRAWAVDRAGGPGAASPVAGLGSVDDVEPSLCLPPPSAIGRDDVAALHEGACFALSNLTKHGDVSVARAVITSDGVRALLPHVLNGPPLTQLHACAATLNLVTSVYAPVLQHRQHSIASSKHTRLPSAAPVMALSAAAEYGSVASVLPQSTLSAPSLLEESTQPFSLLNSRLVSQDTTVPSAAYVSVFDSDVFASPLADGATDAVDLWELWGKLVDALPVPLFMVLLSPAVDSAACAVGDHHAETVCSVLGGLAELATDERVVDTLLAGKLDPVGVVTRLCDAEWLPPDGQRSAALALDRLQFATRRRRRGDAGVALEASLDVDTARWG